MTEEDSKPITNYYYRVLLADAKREEEQRALRLYKPKDKK